MATAFRARSGRFTATWDAAEVAVVVHLLRLTRDFVAPERGETGDPFLDLVAGLGDQPDPEEPSDPALLRLLPVANRTDPEQAAEFRRLTEHSVRSRKAANLTTAMAALAAALPSDGGDAQPGEIEHGETWQGETGQGKTEGREFEAGETEGGEFEADAPLTVDLDADQARAMVMAVTDIRLILGERLGMRTEEDSERLQDEFALALLGELEMDPATAQQMAYYDFLTWVQDSLTTAMLG